MHIPASTVLVHLALHAYMKRPAATIARAASPGGDASTLWPGRAHAVDPDVERRSPQRVGHCALQQPAQLGGAAGGSEADREVGGDVAGGAIAITHT